MDSNNYRGISVASFVCKLFTSVLTERIQKDLAKRDVLGLVLEKILDALIMLSLYYQS